MKPAKFNDKSTFILGWYMPDEVCDLILNEQRGQKRLYYTPLSEAGFRGYRSINLPKLSKTVSDKYIEHLEQIKDLYIKEYPFLQKMHKVEIENCNGHPLINLQRYEPNNFYSVEHFENDGRKETIFRSLVFMTYLNTIEEGGGTNFSMQNFTCKAEKGLTLIWPAYFTHPHIGVPATKDIKYIITGWYNFVPQ